MGFSLTCFLCQRVFIFLLFFVCFVMGLSVHMSYCTNVGMNCDMASFEIVTLMKTSSLHQPTTRLLLTPWTLPWLCCSCGLSLRLMWGFMMWSEIFCFFADIGLFVWPFVRLTISHISFNCPILLLPIVVLALKSFSDALQLFFLLVCSRSKLSSLPHLGPHHLTLNSGQQAAAEVMLSLPFATS